MPERAPTPFTACDAYRYFAGRAFFNDVTKVGHSQSIYYQRIVL